MFGFAIHRCSTAVAVLLAATHSLFAPVSNSFAFNKDATISPPVADKEQGHPVPLVKWEKDLLSVSAQQADIREVLTIIGNLTKVPVSVDRSVTGTVTDEFRDLPLDKGLERLLFRAGEKNLMVEFVRHPGGGANAFAIEKITVLKKAAPAGPTDAERSAAMAAREKEFRDYFEAIDEGKGKIARALKRCQDPTLSPKEKSKLRTYLRQTSVDDPEDKKLLKSALLDDRLRGEIVSDIQMALMHAMQSHQEESDKDFMVELLQRRDNRVGWLYYAMLNVWDKRYVPYLIEDIIEEPRSRSAIEILGRMDVSEAVPFIKNALKDSNYDIRKEAFFALRLLTGQDYPYK